MRIMLIAALLPFAGFSKSIQPEADYYEDGNHAPMCMMCHMVSTPDLNVALTLSSNLNSLLPGEQANITVTRANFKTTWKPGIVLQVAHGDKFAQRAPKDYGWQLTNPKGNPFNYTVWDNAALNSLTWVFKAPKMPGQYTIATSAYFNDGGSSLDTLGAPGTKRGNNTLTIIVGKVAETQKPQLLAVVALYKIYIMLKFSEPIDPATALVASNYQVIKIAGSQAVTVTQVFQSRDETVVYLKTAAQDPQADYSVTVRNLKDYASTPNIIDPATKTFRQDLTVPCKFTCMLAQDLTQSAFMWYDHFEHLGNDSAKAINRINLSFIITPSTSDVLDKPVDMLADIPFDTAKLMYRVAEATALTSSPDQWDLYRIYPSQGLDPDSLSAQWSGYNQAGTPVATSGKEVTLVQNGVPQTWWEWDITQDFRTAYTAKTRGLEFRLKARTENTLTGGVAFYGHDHDSVTFRPHIALTFKPVATAAESFTFMGDKTGLQISPNPVRGWATIRIPAGRSGVISIYDLRGRKVSEFRTGVDGVAHWESRNLSNGVYWVSTATAYITFTRKVLVSK